MGSYKEIEGDLLDLFENGEFDMIAHGANCHSTMGAGIAYQIAKKYPKVYYADYYSSMKLMQKLGSYTYALVDGIGVIVNLYTQYNPGPNADLDAIKLCMKKLAYLGKYLNRPNIGLPLIGCGIGSLNWEDVKPIIQEELKDMNVTIVHYNK